MEISPVMNSARNKRIRMRVENVFECLTEIFECSFSYFFKRILETENHLVSSFGSPSCVFSSFINSNMSPGWQSNTSQIALSVEKRIALIFPVFIFERFKILDMK